MALVKCRECGVQVSSKAKTCPNCGVKAPKKTSIVTWAVLIFIIFAAWGSIMSPDRSSNPSRSSVATNSSTPASTPKPKVSEPAKPRNAWNYRVDKDKMTGKETGYIVAYSKNTLKGWLKDGKVIMGYTCGIGFYVRINDVGFATDDIDCGRYSCTHDHHARVRFDDGPTESVYFDVWDDNNDGMTLLNRKYSHQEKMEAYFINGMKSGQTMYLELETFQTNGMQQIAEFSLTGFTAAINSCPS